MLNADSSALKNESDDQSRPMPPMIPSAAALSCTRRTSLMMLLSEVPGKRVLQLLDEEVGRLGAMSEAEEREREEDEGHEREQREVGDHRREMRAAVGEELVRRAGADGSPRMRSLHLDTVGAMDAAAALADLVEISPQIEAAAVVAQRRRAGRLGGRPRGARERPRARGAGAARRRRGVPRATRAASPSCTPSSPAETCSRWPATGGDRRRRSRTGDAGPRLLRPEALSRGGEDDRGT